MSPGHNQIILPMRATKQIQPIIIVIFPYFAHRPIRIHIEVAWLSNEDYAQNKFEQEIEIEEDGGRDLMDATSN